MCPNYPQTQLQAKPATVHGLSHCTPSPQPGSNVPVSQVETLNTGGAAPGHLHPTDSTPTCGPPGEAPPLLRGTDVSKCVCQRRLHVGEAGRSQGTPTRACAYPPGNEQERRRLGLRAEGSGGPGRGLGGPRPTRDRREAWAQSTAGGRVRRLPQTRPGTRLAQRPSPQEGRERGAPGGAPKTRGPRGPRAPLLVWAGSWCSTVSEAVRAR